MRRRRIRPKIGAGPVIGLGILLAIVVVLAASPRHRAFYSRLIAGRPSPSASEALRGTQPAVVLQRPGPAAAPTPATSRPPSFAAPIVSEPHPAVPAPSAALTSPAAEKVPRGRGGDDEVPVPVLEELQTRLPLAGPPPAWELKEFAGRAQVEVVREDERPVLHLSSERSSYALYRDVALDVKDFPVLTWSWKVTKLPTGGDIRERATDDQAGQVYVIFPRWPFPRINSDVVGYIWDSRAPVGLRVTSPQASNVKLVVVESGAERLGQWVREERSVYRDYVELFGKEPPRVGKVAIMIDSNDTRSQAEAFVAALAFRRAGHQASSADTTGRR